MFRFAFFLGIFVTLGYLSTFCASQDILGCGGFVKSEVEINFSLVEVKLYTKQGSLKYRTDCAPNNGYYMVPVYDKGDYVLKVDPPPGWTFEPESVDLHIDGTNDACSKGIDINFQFTGFGVVGKVVSKGQAEGPAGVTLTLTKVGSDEVIKETTSAEGGEYTFEKILPGEFEVTASHPTWTFEKATTKVTVGRETGNAGTSITIKGYDLTGQVFSNGEPIRGVNFVLYSTTQTRPDVADCNQGSVPGMPDKDAKGALCYVISGEDGVFSFPSLTFGDYRIVPFYKGDHITFDVVPSEVKVTVRHDSVVLKDHFQVAGFSVQGKVLNVAKGVGVAGAHVYLDGKEQAVTKTDGTYHLDSMRVGTYTLVVKDRYLFFDPVTVKVTPNTPYLPDIVASRFSLCGRVVIDKIPEGLGSATKERDVTLTPLGQKSKVTTMKTDSKGEFCVEVAPGDYEVQVVISDTEARAGLKLAPSSAKITITDSPSLSTVFSQFRATISGKVTCLEKCGTQQVSLVSSGRSDDYKVTQAVGDGKTGIFEFKDVMPGTYKVALMNELWCWKEKSFDISVIDADVTDLHFVQSGYILSCSLSHDITLNFAQENKPGNVGSFNLAKGVNKFCLSEPGVYKLSPDSCHMFEQDIYSYDTSAPSMLTLVAVKHRAEGVVVTKERQEDLTVTIKSSVEGDAPIKLGPLVSDKEPQQGKDKKVKEAKGPFSYKFDYWARAGEKLDIQVFSSELLFSPASTEVTIRGDKCPGEVVKFEGRKGMFISGLITPPLEGVHIAIKDTNNDKFKVTLDTDRDGKFRVGPLDSSTEYVVSAEREGYVFTEVEGKLGHFNAFKLGEINVMVTDNDGNFLQSVLLSLSGSNQYRSNKLTQENGAMAFLGLSPGQYFLRPMMKEYSFEPASQMISVAEGDTINFAIKGTRIAFSCYGSVTSLNGEPEPDVIVEAVGLETCREYQEESKTEQDGSYRIRGLQPNCEYTIRLKTKDVNHHIERSSARVKSVKVENEDLKDVTIIAFRRLNQLDLSGNVVALAEHLPTIKIHLYKESNPDSPLHKVSLLQNSFFYLPSLTIDNQIYVIRMESTLSRSGYDYSIEEKTFVANTSHQHFTFTFQPKPRLVDQELSHSSFLVLPFTLLIIFLVYHHQQVLPVLGQAFSYFQSLMTSSASSQSSSTAAATYQINPELFADTSSTNKKKQKARKA